MATAARSAAVAIYVDPRPAQAFNCFMYRKKLLQTLHHEIPLSRAMGIEVLNASADAVTLQAPLTPNINHKSTAFGGSLYCVAVLAGWSLIWGRLQQHGLTAHIVIQQSEITYQAPMTGEIRATCRLDSEAAFERALRMFDKHGKARITLEVEITGDTGTAVRLTGNYVIHH